MVGLASGGRATGSYRRGGAEGRKLRLTVAVRCIEC